MHCASNRGRSRAAGAVAHGGQELSVSYVVILEGPETRLVTEYASRAEAVPAVEQEVDRLQAAGATIEAICPAAISLGGRNRRPRKKAVLASRRHQFGRPHLPEALAR